MNLDNIDKVQAVIIRLRKNEHAKTSKNVLIAMLEELLKRDSAESKKKKMEEEYSIVMDVETERKVNTMCNLSEVVLEKGIEQKMIELVRKKIEKGYNPEQIAEILEEDVAVIEPIYAEIMRQINN